LEETICRKNIWRKPYAGNFVLVQEMAAKSSGIAAE